MSKQKFPLTNQRAVILDFMKDNHSHPTVDDVYAHIKERLPRISKKTVYSNLQFLAKEGLIQEVKAKGAQRYDPDTGMHLHLICLDCGKVADAAPKELEAGVCKRAKGLKGFSVENASITLYGHCKTCKGGMK